MTPARHDELVRRLTGISRKVYEDTPIGTTWSTSAICTELFRLGTRSDLKVVAGCLAGLVLDGLVREPSTGLFSRVNVRAIKATMSNPVPAFDEPKPAVLSPSEKLAELSMRLVDLAAEIDRVNIEYRNLIEAISADSRKLKALQSTLSSLMQP